MVLCTTLLRVLQVTLTSLCSTIITTLLQVFLVTFVALCCTVSMTLLRILHVTFMASLMHYFSLGVSCSCHGFVLHCQHSSSLNLLDNPPFFVIYLLIVCCISNTAYVHSHLKFTCSHFLKSLEISCGKYVMQ